MKARHPDNEAHRLAILHDYQVLDTLPEQVFDDLTLLAAQICQTPIALISLIDEERQWFKSKIGMNATETSRDLAFCSHAILNAEEIMEVRDAQLDPRFADNPLVTADPHIRFYAGAPLVSPDGLVLGTLCAIDQVPRELNEEQKIALGALSRTVVALLESRRTARLREREKKAKLSQVPARWALEKTTIVIFFAAALALLIVGAISIRSLMHLSEEVERVQHTYEVLESAESMMKNMLDVQSGQRGYIITGKEEFLETYSDAQTAVQHDVQELRKLTEDNLYQQQQLDKLMPLVTERLTVAQYLISLRRAQSFEAAQNSPALGLGKNVMNEIRLLQNKMVAEEERLLAERNHRKRHGMMLTLVSIGCLGALAIILLGLAGRRIWREMMQRSAAQSHVEMLNTDLESRAIELAAARHRAEASDQFKSAILEHAGHAIISTTPDGVITTFNRTAELMLGYTSAEVIGLQTPALWHDPSEVAQRAREFSKVLGEAIAPGCEVFFAKARRSLPNEHEWIYIRKDGSRLPVLLTVTTIRDGVGIITGFLGMAIDIAERKRVETELHDKQIQLHQALEELRQREETILNLALHDELTGLPNRRLFHDRLTLAINEARRRNFCVAVAFIDLDYFKQINDTLGHEAGDKFLIIIADKIKAESRESDTCARLGGDEFALILSNLAGKDQVEMVMRRILDSLNREFMIEGVARHGSASIGLAIFPDNADDLPTLLNRADMAMYRAKEEGRNTYRFWDENMVSTRHTTQADSTRVDLTPVDSPRPAHSPTPGGEIHPKR